MNRWLIWPEEYDYEIIHLNSAENNKADILSRSFLIISDLKDTLKTIENHLLEYVKFLVN